MSDEQRLRYLSVVHGAIMAVQATHNHMERANLIGELPAFARFAPLPHPLPARGARE